MALLSGKAAADSKTGELRHGMSDGKQISSRLGNSPGEWEAKVEADEGLQRDEHRGHGGELQEEELACSQHRAAGISLVRLCPEADLSARRCRWAQTWWGMVAFQPAPSQQGSRVSQHSLTAQLLYASTLLHSRKLHLHPFLSTKTVTSFANSPTATCRISGRPACTTHSKKYPSVSSAVWQQMLTQTLPVLASLSGAVPYNAKVVLSNKSQRLRPTYSGMR